MPTEVAIHDLTLPAAAPDPQDVVATVDYLFALVVRRGHCRLTAEATLGSASVPWRIVESSDAPSAETLHESLDTEPSARCWLASALTTWSGRYAAALRSYDSAVGAARRSALSRCAISPGSGCASMF